MMLLLLLLPESRSNVMATRNDERAAAVRAMSGTVQREPRFFMSDLREVEQEALRCDKVADIVIPMYVRRANIGYQFSLRHFPRYKLKKITSAKEIRLNVHKVICQIFNYNSVNRVFLRISWGIPDSH